MLRRIFDRLSWLLTGCPSVKYDHYWCGLCGRFWKESFTLPAYESYGKWADTWGLCPSDKGCMKEYYDNLKNGGLL